MSAILKQNAVDIANAFEKYGLWKGGGSSGSVSAEIKELWSGQQSTNGTLTLLDDYSKYDIIVSQIEPLENYPLQQSYAFMLKGGSSLTGGMCENTTNITQYRLREWNGTSVYFSRDTNPSGWNVTLKKIYGIKFNNEIHEYSTEEKIVGKWIDGKNIYEQIFIIGSKNANYTFTIDNLNNIINYSGFCTISGYKRNIPFIQTQYNSFVIINDYKDGVVNLTTNLSYNDCVLIIQYTKTE